MHAMWTEAREGIRWECMAGSKTIGSSIFLLTDADMPLSVCTSLYLFSQGCFLLMLFSKRYFYVEDCA